MQIANRTFLITGGGSGLGAATAALFANEGANVILADVNVDQGNETAEAIGNRARFLETDVTDETSVRRTITTAVSDFGAIHGAINCAGIVAGEKVLGKDGPHNYDNFKRIININLFGTFNIIRLVADVMAKNKPEESGERGIIINTSSIASFEGQIGQAAYSASKAGINGMTLPIARELAKHGIRVVTIAPGIFDTPMMAGLSEEVRTSLGQQVPFPPRLGRPAEFASLAKHIIQNELLNGTVIRLDGAIRMASK